MKAVYAHNIFTLTMQMHCIFEFNMLDSFLHLKDFTDFPELCD